MDQLEKKYPTFKTDGYRKVFCSGCKGFTGARMRLGEKNQKAVKCKQCRVVSVVFPPRMTMEGEMKVIKFGPNEGCFTADLTEAEIEG